MIKIRVSVYHGTAYVICEYCVFLYYGMYCLTRMNTLVWHAMFTSISRECVHTQKFVNIASQLQTFRSFVVISCG